MQFTTQTTSTTGSSIVSYSIFCFWIWIATKSSLSQSHTYFDRFLFMHAVCIKRLFCFTNVLYETHGTCVVVYVMYTLVFLIHFRKTKRNSTITQEQIINDPIHNFPLRFGEILISYHNIQMCIYLCICYVLQF